MKTETFLRLCAVWWVGILPTAATAEPPPKEDLSALLQQLTRRIDELEKQHRQDQQRIETLEQRLTELEHAAEHERIEPQTPPAETPPPAAVPPPTTSTPAWLSLSGMGTGNELNPAITVFLDGGGSLSSRGENKALNRFNLREVELDLRAAISPAADGVLILTAEENIEQDRSGRVDISRDVDIEEGYIFFHSLPHDLSLKLGKFRNAFGRNNVLHTHDLPQVTRPLAVTNFLGPEGLLTTGASLSWLVPNPWDQYLQLTVEVVNDDGGEESPLLGGANADNPAVVGHLRYFRDLTETSTLEVGGSYLFSRTGERSDFDANLFGLDLTYQWIDPDPSRFRSLVLQSELFWAQNDVDRGPFRSGRNDSFGMYAFAQYQLSQNHYVGLRADYSEFPNSTVRSTRDADFALSPYLTWYFSEFLRARLEYQHRWFDRNHGPDDEDAVLLQFTGVVGAHPPHPYWVHR